MKKKTKKEVKKKKINAYGVVDYRGGLLIFRGQYAVSCDTRGAVVLAEKINSIDNFRAKVVPVIITVIPIK